MEEEASILRDHDLSQLGANSGEFSLRIAEPAEAAALEADAANARAGTEHAAAKVWLDSDPEPEDLVSEIAPGGKVERDITAGFDASLAQQRAVVSGGAYLAARCMILAARALMPPFGYAVPGFVSVLTSAACGHQAGSANWLGPPMTMPKEDPDVVWRRVTHDELVRQTSWILDAVPS
jgi:hypothetical protein